MGYSSDLIVNSQSGNCHIEIADEMGFFSKMFGYGDVVTYGERDNRYLGRDVLKVKKVDMLIDDNSKAHRTNEYDICNRKKSPNLVVRRGQRFDFQIYLSRPYDDINDDLRVTFDAGHRGTEVKLQPKVFDDKEVKPDEWAAKITEQKGYTVGWDIVTVSVYPPATCGVGKWNLGIEHVMKKDNGRDRVFRYEHDDPVYILFNPWCEHDSVYMEDDELLQEYVLNESGRIWKGSRHGYRGRSWNFGQFESCVLDVALYLLDLTRLSWSSRGDPIDVTRKCQR